MRNSPLPALRPSLRSLSVSHRQSSQPQRRCRRGPGTALAALAAVLVLLGGCSSNDPGTPATSGSVTSGKVLIVAAKRRGEPVRMVGTTLEGARLDLASLRGRPVVLNVWGSWCAPCRKEAPALVAAEQALRPRGVTFVGIDVRDDKAAARAFQRRFTVPYPSLFDDGDLMLALRGAASAAAVPSTLILDSGGRVAARVVGIVDATTLIGMVETVGGLSPPPSATSTATSAPPTSSP